MIPCQTVGWPLFARAARLWRGEESPGSTEARCRVTPGGGDPRESATENIPPSPCGPLRGIAWAARVKWCGKSAPRRRQRRWQGKPHREQDQVGAAGRFGIAGAAGRAFRAAARVGRVRRSATNVPDEWPSPLSGGTEPGLQTVWRLVERDARFPHILCLPLLSDTTNTETRYIPAHRKGRSAAWLFIPRQRSRRPNST
jgi:hypothetical protein